MDSFKVALSLESEMRFFFHFNHFNLQIFGISFICCQSTLPLSILGTQELTFPEHNEQRKDFSQTSAILA